MFDFATPYLDMYKTQPFKFKERPIVLHRSTCPECGKTLVNLYYSSTINKYLCKDCLSIFLKDSSQEGSSI